MGFLTSKRSSQLMERPLPRTKASLKKCNLSNRPKESLLTVSKKKISATFCESEMEDIDIEMQLKLAEGMSDESSCMWLSSDCDCSSLLGSDVSGDLYQLNDWNHSSIDSSFMGSVKSDSTGHDLQIDPTDEFSKKHGILTDKSVCCSESAYDRFRKELWRHESSSSPLSTLDDLDKNVTWISTVDLNLECSGLLQLKLGVNSTSVGFSSPSSSYNCNPQSESSLSSPSSATTYHLKEASSSVSSEFDHNEPLFWPYNQNFYESSELDNFLCMSPRKEEKMAGKNQVNQLKSVETKLKKTYSQSGSRKSMQLQFGRRLESSLTPKKSYTGLKSVTPKGKNYNNAQRPPLQLNTSLAQTSRKLLPYNTLTKKKINSNTKETSRLKSINQKNKMKEFPEKTLLEFEASFFQDFFVEGATIEKIIGLNEFDAREWLNFKFNDDCFAESMKKEESSQVGRETFLHQLFGTTL